MGSVDMCDHCNVQARCAQLTMQRAPSHPSISVGFTTNGKCLNCKKVGFCVCIQFAEILFKFCPGCITWIEHKTYEFKGFENDRTKTWKPYAGGGMGWKK